MQLVALGAEADNPMGSVSSNNKAVTTLAICCKFQKTNQYKWFSAPLWYMYMTFCRLVVGLFNISSM